MITVITPTYNRAYILHKCYESLIKQTSKKFKWLIIDDGSNDNTEEIVKEWIDEKKIKIDYIKKENGGKASALNLAIDNLDTEYAVCLDSDDYFYDDTIENAINDLNNIETNKECCGILALRNNPDGSVMGKKEVPLEMEYVTVADIFLKLGLRTELICFYKVDILKNFRFPIFENEKFVSPSWMQYTVTQNYKFKMCWKKLCICEYVNDGLTKNKKKVIIKNPKGYTCVKLLSFNLSGNLIQKIKNGIMLNYGAILSNDNIYTQLNLINRLLAMALRPLGYIVYIIRARGL